MRYVSILYSDCTGLPVKEEVLDNIFTSLSHALFKDKVAYDDNENLVKLTLDDVEENVEGNNEVTNRVFFFLQ